MVYPVTIEFVLNGFVATVGCHKLVYSSIQDLVADLRKYLKNPTKTEQEFREGALNAKFLPGAPPPEPPSITSPSQWWTRLADAPSTSTPPPQWYTTTHSDANV